MKPTKIITLIALVAFTTPVLGSVVMASSSEEQTGQELIARLLLAKSIGDTDTIKKISQEPHQPIDRLVIAAFTRDITTIKNILNENPTLNCENLSGEQLSVLATMFNKFKRKLSSEEQEILIKCLLP